MELGVIRWDYKVHERIGDWGWKIRKKNDKTEGILSIKELFNLNSF